MGWRAVLKKASSHPRHAIRLEAQIRHFALLGLSHFGIVQAADFKRFFALLPSRPAFATVLSSLISKPNPHGFKAWSAHHARHPEQPRPRPRNLGPTVDLRLTLAQLCQ
jgi:hypothetical protein